MLRLEVCLDGRLIQGDKGRKVHPKRCRLIRTRTSGPAGQPVGSTPRDTGCQGQSRGGARGPTGRNRSEVRGDRERADAEADPSLARGGRADREAIDPCPCPVYQGIGHSPLDGGCGSSRQARPGRRSRLQHPTRAVVASGGCRTGSRTRPGHAGGGKGPAGMPASVRRAVTNRLTPSLGRTQRFRRR